jgi:hypothetical protein
MGLISSAHKTKHKLVNVYRSERCMHPLLFKTKTSNIRLGGPLIKVRNSNAAMLILFHPTISHCTHQVTCDDLTIESNYSM